MNLVKITSLAIILTIIACQNVILQEPNMYIRREDWPKACASLEKAKIANPKEAQIRYLLGDAYGHLDRYNDMIREFNAAKKLNPRFESKVDFGISYYWTVNYNKGHASLSKGNYRLAIPNLKHAVYLRPNKVESRIGLGRAYFLVDSLENAAGQFEVAISIDKKDLSTLYNLAETYFQLGRYEDCLTMCEKVLLIDGKHWNTLVKRAYALEALKRDEEAVDAFSTALEVKSKKDLLIHFGLFCSKIGKHNLAINSLKKAHALSGDKIATARLVGEACWQGRFFPEMVRWYSSILYEKPDDVEALHNLEVAYHFMGQIDKLSAIKQKLKLAEKKSEK